MDNTALKFFDLDQYDIENRYIDQAPVKHEYRILVPVDDKAAERMYGYDIYTDGFVSSCFQGLAFLEDTYFHVEDIFYALNDALDLFIHCYEEEIIWNENLEKAAVIVEQFMNRSEDAAKRDFARELLNLIKTAVEYETVVGFYF